MCVGKGWYYLEAKQVDEVSIKNYKNIFTIISAVSLCLTVMKASNILDVFIPSFTYLCSNLLAFYAINARSAEKLKSRERVKKAYIYILGDFCYTSSKREYQNKLSSIYFINYL